MRTSFDMTRRPGYGGVVGVAGEHLAWIDILEVAYDAWVGVLEKAGRDDLRMSPNFAVANVTTDYRKEMFRNTLEFDTTVERVGNSSLTICMVVSQAGVHTATARVVLVRVAPGRDASAGFTTQQREVLMALAE